MVCCTCRRWLQLQWTCQPVVELRHRMMMLCAHRQCQATTVVICQTCQMPICCVELMLAFRCTTSHLRATLVLHRIPPVCQYTCWLTDLMRLHQPQAMKLHLHSCKLGTGYIRCYLASLPCFSQTGGRIYFQMYRHLFLVMSTLLCGFSLHSQIILCIIKSFISSICGSLWAPRHIITWAKLWLIKNFDII